jgi:hypothetical protein
MQQKGTRAFAEDGARFFFFSWFEKENKAKVVPKNKIKQKNR